jgi:hypothetical protein
VAPYSTDLTGALHLSGHLIALSAATYKNPHRYIQKTAEMQIRYSVTLALIHFCNWYISYFQTFLKDSAKPCFDNA